MSEESNVFESEEFQELDTESQDDKIFEEAEKERLEEEKQRDPNYVPPDEDDTPSEDTKEVTPEDEKPAEEEPAEEEKKDEEEKEKAVEDDDASEEGEKPDDDTDKDPEPNEEEHLVEQVKAYALKHNISEEDAQKDIESIGKIESKYEKDSFELSKANLYLQRMVSHTQQELKALQQPAEGFFADHAVVQGKRISKEAIIADQKEMFPNKTENEEDDAVYEMAKEMYETKVKTYLAIQQQEIPQKAAEIRKLSLSKLTGVEKTYESEIKEMLDSMDDRALVEPTFNANTVVSYTKGLHYDDDVKTAEKAGYERGLKQQKIIGEKQVPKGSVKTKKGSDSKTAGLTDVEKEAALDLYDGDNIPDETKYKYYKEQLEHEEKLKTKKAS